MAISPAPFVEEITLSLGIGLDLLVKSFLAVDVWVHVRDEPTENMKGHAELLLL